MTRITASKWVEAGLDTLKSEGLPGLKADRIAKKLGVSRGSFYWHFSDIKAFRIAILEAWEVATQQIATQAQQPADPQEKLTYLIVAATSADHSREQAVRAWGKIDKVAASYIDRVDRLRVETLSLIFQELNFEINESQARAKLLFAAALGFSAVGPKLDIGQLEVSLLAKIFTSPSPLQ